MKRIVWILSAAVMLVACGGKENPVSPTPQENLSVSPTTLSFAEEDTSTKLITVSASGSWSASASAGWIHVTPASGSGNGSLSVKVDANTGEGARTGSVDVACGSKKASVSVTQSGAAKIAIVPTPAAFDGNKRASTTYQLLIYSFADSDGDGIGDFKGIQNKLDYLDDLGATALWLSPAHPADSYHGYDVTDYYSLNSQYASGNVKTAEKAEADFKDLLNAAHAKGIKIYMDYVLNHSGKGHPWFQSALSSPSSEYRDYYFISSNPSVDYSKFPMLKGTRYEGSEWKAVTSGSPQIKISATDEAVTEGSSNWNLYTWKDGENAKEIRFVEKGDGTLYLVANFSGKSGILIRKYMNWDPGSKFGAKSGQTTLKEGVALDLVANGEDIWFTGNGRYKLELSNISTETMYFMGAFGDWMPDLNYGDIDDVENNACFKDLAASADKWINMGVDGFRLDAVKHICGGISSYNNAANRKFLKKWYDHCNATYHAAGHSDNIFMVGEVWDDHANVEKYYYEGLKSCFEFGYWPVLYRALTTGNASSYVSTVSGFILDHQAVRPDAETSLFLTNHDHSSQTGGGEVRAADDLGKNLAKEKQAAAMLLTSGGKPFVYQGEELGYWGDSRNKGDEYLRAPIVWDDAATQIAKKGVNNKVDNSMLTGAISVENQSADENSLLNVYKTWSRLRNTYPALATGEMTPVSLSGSSFAAWYMTSGSQKLLVVHNCAGSEKSVSVSDSMTKPIALLGTGFVKEQTLILGPNSSVVFQL